MEKNTANTQISLPKIAMLGCGSMGGAILDGLIAAGARDVFVTTASTESAEKLAAKGVETAALSADKDANKRAIKGASVVILGVKPWLIAEVLEEIASDLEAGTVVISVAAGITLETMRDLLPENVHVVRSMPNTPAAIGLGVTGISAADDAPEEALDIAEQIFSTVGEVVRVPEEQINALSAVSGSGPAYVFWFAEVLTKSAERLGFTAEQAKILAENTVIGAAALLQKSDETPEKLRKNVTSPGGTTAQAIEVFQASGFDETTDKALNAAIKRAGELADGK